LETPPRVLNQLAATAIALTHALFIAFVVLGGLLVLKWPRLAWIHLPAAVWGMLVEFAGWYCPLTRWENHFLRAAGRAGYEGAFLNQYLMPLIYPSGLTRGTEIALGMFVLAINAIVYMRVFR
jgi:hypothetical protein